MLYFSKCLIFLELLRNFSGTSPDNAIMYLNFAIEFLEQNNIEDAKTNLASARFHLQRVRGIAQQYIDNNRNEVSTAMSSMLYQIGFTKKHIETIDNCTATLPNRKDHIIAVLKGKETFQNN